MAVGDPIVLVFCDREDCDYECEYGMTALVRNSWDLRNLNQQLESDGWKIEGEDTHICPDCVYEDEEKAYEEEYGEEDEEEYEDE